jgi:hypothetical protein
VYYQAIGTLHLARYHSIVMPDRGRWLSCMTRQKGVDNFTIPLYSLSPTWHTHAASAAPLERRACCSSSRPMLWSCHDTPSIDSSGQPSSVPGGGHQPRRLAAFPLPSEPPCCGRTLVCRGMIVSYEAIRTWCRKFGQAYANALRRWRPRPGDTWHLDEGLVVLQICTLPLCVPCC